MASNRLRGATLKSRAQPKVEFQSLSGFTVQICICDVGTSKRL